MRLSFRGQFCTIPAAERRLGVLGKDNLVIRVETWISTDSHRLGYPVP